MSLLDNIGIDLWGVILDKLKMKESGKYFNLTMIKLASICDDIKKIMFLPININNIIKDILYDPDKIDLYPNESYSNLEKCFHDHRKHDMYTMELCNCCQMKYAKDWLHCHVYCNKCVREKYLQCRECIKYLNEFGSYIQRKCPICFSTFQNGCRLCGEIFTVYSDTHSCGDDTINIKICELCVPLYQKKFIIKHNCTL